MSLTLDEVQRVARLAALELSDSEAQALAHDLASILDFIATLDTVDVTGVEPTTHPIALDGPLRADRVVPPPISRAALLAAAPETEHGAFAVPKVLDGDG